MLNLSIRQVDFNELKVENLSKRPILDALQKFWTKSENEFYEFLEQNDLDFYKKYSSIAELKDGLAKDIEKINTIAQNESGFFDYKIINALKPRYLKEINDYDFFKITIDLREVTDNQKQAIIDSFLETKSVSLVDFVDITDDSCSIICHKKGAMYYHNEPVMTNTRTNNLTLLENFKVPKDYNFILARFLFDFANKLDDNDINESISTISYNNEKIVKNIKELIYWGNLTPEEKEDVKDTLNKAKQVSQEAKDIAKTEIRQEINAKRESLNQGEAKKQVDENKDIRLDVGNDFVISNIANRNIKIIPEKKSVELDSKIADIVARSIELYKQKETEKFKMKMERAEKDSFSAYGDLKELLNNGLSIIEALKNIQQKYRNEDTINLASLLFSKDVLSLSSREKEISNLNRDMDNLKKELESTYNEVEKREETISKLRSTLQTKINEASNIKYELEKEFSTKLQVLEAEHANEISAYAGEIEELNTENEKLFNENNNLNSKVNALEQSLNNQKFDFERMGKDNKAITDENIKLKMHNESLSQKAKEAENSTKAMYKLEAQLDVFKEKENLLKEQNTELKNKIAELESRLFKMTNNTTHSTQDESKTKRSRDILG